VFGTQALRWAYTRLLAGAPELAEELLEVRDVVVVDVVEVVADAVAVAVGRQPVQGVDALDVDLRLAWSRQ
jgi:hypothetical protein